MFGMQAKFLLYCGILLLGLLFLDQVNARLPGKKGYALRRNIIKKGGNRLIVTDKNGNEHSVSNRYGWSAHNCQHSGPKTGVVLYPQDSKYKNTVILVCEKHYELGVGKSGTQHEQLHKWYYDIYGESKQFRLASGFSQRHDGSLGFASTSLNAIGPYTDDQREMGDIEKDAVRIVVNGQLDDYTVT